MQQSRDPLTSTVTVPLSVPAPELPLAATASVRASDSEARPVTSSVGTQQKQTDVTACVCPASVRRARYERPVAIAAVRDDVALEASSNCHNLMDLSADAVAMIEPVGSNATSVTEAV